MARRILTADSALRPHTQVTLQKSALTSVRTEKPDQILQTIEGNWNRTLPGDDNRLIFDWSDRKEMMAEIDFVNRVQATLDEAAIKVAPSLLRIVLTVKRNLLSPREQRAFLADHLDLDFRRISELCIVAESYALLDPQKRSAGEREINTYGWSKALKLSYVRDSSDRRGIWERAKGGKSKAGYRAVLEEIRRFRERKTISSTLPEGEIESRLEVIREQVSAIHAVSGHMNSREDFQEALLGLRQMSREISEISRALQQRIVDFEVEELAVSA